MESILMFDIGGFYNKAAASGESLDLDGLFRFLKSFRHVYIWGAGNLGVEVCSRLQDLGIPITAFWDSRAKSLGKCNGIDVINPFTTQGSTSDSLVIFCITSSFVKDYCLSDLRQHGFSNLIMGDYIYAGLICNFNDRERFETCRNATACDVYTCEKNEVFHKRFLGLENIADEDTLYFRNITFVINQKCTLKCKYCYSYTNAYDRNLRINFPIKQILSDIDKTFDSIDGVKIVPLIGGETFLHPELDIIIKKFLQKSNFGILNITTNGVVKIHERHLDVLQDPRIQVVFSNYKTSLSAKQNDIFDANIEKVKSSGAHVIILNETPQWMVPTTLWHRNYSIETMIEKRKACFSPLICKYVKNGKFFPCTIADSVHNVGVADYPEDYVNLNALSSRDQIRVRLFSLLRRSYFDSCGHCDGTCGSTGVVASAGEQGYYEVKQTV